MDLIKLECFVEDCAYNEERNCKKGTIIVIGKDAMCADFEEED